MWTAASTRTGARPWRSTAARITGPQFFPTSLVNYFRPDGIRFVDYFPWVTLPAEPARGVRRRLPRPDLPHRQRHGLHAAACSLLTVLAVPVLFRPGVDRARRGAAGPAGRRGARHRRRDGLRLRRQPLHQRVRARAGARRRRRHLRARRRRRAPAAPASRSRWPRPALWPRTAFSIAAQMLTGFATAAMTAGGPATGALPALQQRLTPARRRPRLVARVGRPSRRGGADRRALRPAATATRSSSTPARTLRALAARRAAQRGRRATLDPDFGTARVLDRRDRHRSRAASGSRRPRGRGPAA